MDFQDLKEFDDKLRGNISDYSEYDNLCAFKGLVPLPLDAISASYTGEEDIEVYDENNQFLGFLCFCKSLDEIDLNSITDAQYIAYLNEVEKDSFELDLPYRFKKDYLILDKSRYNEYIANYIDSSPLWGGFLHTNSFNLNKAYQYTPIRIRARPNLKLPTNYHTESCTRSVIQPYAFERFLKLYHLLELIFDWNLVQSIKNLNDDLKDIGRLLNRYSGSKDTERLNELLMSKYREGKLNIDKISDLLNNLGNPNYLQKGKIILFDFGKEGNPFNKKDIISIDQLMSKGGFTRKNAKDQTVKGITEDNYEKFVIEFTIYCIYRVRCSTAHSRIGEYVMSSDDEEFVVRFAEPLLREVLYQVFTI